MKFQLKLQFFLWACMLMVIANVSAQPPKLYINIVSHNEPGDLLQDQTNFERSKGLVLQFADLVVAGGGKWNLGTCDGFVLGALNHQNGGTNTGDVLETLVTNPLYAGKIEIDPRNKNLSGTNIADLWYLLDSCGAQPSKNLSGFIYSSTTSTRPDWMEYEDTVKGLIYNASWKAEVIWGAGSLQPHTNDLNDYGIWKPTDTTNFYTHDSNGRLWYQGNGCQPVQGFDSTENEQLVIAQIKGAVDSIQSGMWPDTNFYCYSITINQRQFGATLFAKMSTILDSIHAIDPAKIAWATITEKHREFLSWGGGTGDYSQWNCGTPPVAAPEPTAQAPERAYPNPFRDHLSFQFDDGRSHAVTLYNGLGQVCKHAHLRAGEQLDCAGLLPGVYVAVVDGKRSLRLLKE